MRSTILAATLAAGLLILPASALAQTPKPKPLPFIVFDIRGASAGLGKDIATATDLNVLGVQLPGRGLALSAGVNTYPFRRRGFAVGLGVEGILSRAVARDVVAEDLTAIREIRRELSGISGVLSLNFGGRDGWSYLSGGIGPLRFTSTSSEIPHGTAPATTTLNAGGGARWFVKPRLAAGFDVRVYFTKPALPTAESAGRDRMNVFVIAIGITLR